MGRDTALLTTCLCLCWRATTVAVALQLEPGRPVACEPIKIDLCMGLGYNATGMPNLAKNALQADAKYELETFAPLIQSQCSSELQFFLCSVYAPMCVADAVSPQQVIGPCRPLCLRVRQNCHPWLVDVGFDWPQVLNCSKFPATNNHDHMCMEGPGGGERRRKGGQSGQTPHLPPNLFNTLQTNPVFMKKVKEQLSNVDKDQLSFINYQSYQNYVDLIESGFGKKQPPRCRAYREPRHYHYISRLDRCVPDCLADLQFTSDHKHTYEILLSVASSVSLAASLFTLATFLLSPDRHFPYPERAVVFMTFCSLGLSLGFVLRLVLGREEVSCQPVDGDNGNNDDPGRLLLNVEGHRNSACFIVFLFLFYFSTALSVWATLAFLACFLRSAMSVPQQTMAASLANVFHVVGWCLPAGLTVVAILFHKIEAEELSAVCLVGAQDRDSLLRFVVVPESVLLCVDFVLAVVGVCMVLFRNEQQVPAQDGGEKKHAVKTNSVQRRTLVYLGFCFLTKVLWLSTYVYEYVDRPSWILAPTAPSSSSQSTPPNALYEVFVLRVYLLLLPGSLYAAMWVWSQDSIQAWNACLLNSCCWRRRKTPTPTYPTDPYPKVEYSRQQQAVEATIHPPLSSEASSSLPQQYHPQQQMPRGYI